MNFLVLASLLALPVSSFASVESFLCSGNQSLLNGAVVGTATGNLQSSKSLISGTLNVIHTRSWPDSEKGSENLTTVTEVESQSFDREKNIQSYNLVETKSSYAPGGSKIFLTIDLSTVVRIVAASNRPKYAASMTHTIGNLKFEYPFECSVNLTKAP